MRESFDKASESSHYSASKELNSKKDKDEVLNLIVGSSEGDVLMYKDIENPHAEITPSMFPSLKGKNDMITGKDSLLGRDF